MPRSVLHGWPYHSNFRRLHFCGSVTAIGAEQPVVWIVAAPFHVTRIEPGSHAFFPAVLDTGYAGRLFMNHRHLTRWSNVDRTSMLAGRYLETVHGQTIPRLQMKIWLLLDDPIAEVDRAFSRAMPLRIEEGVTVMPHTAAAPWNDRPELPLLGMRLFADNAMTLTINARQRTIDLQTDRRW